MPKKRKPSYLRHKPTGQARVRIDGRDHYLGAYGSPESYERYEDLIGVNGGEKVQRWAVSGGRRDCVAPR